MFSSFDSCDSDQCFEAATEEASSERTGGNLSGLRMSFAAAALAAAGILTSGCGGKITLKSEEVDRVACSPNGKMVGMTTVADMSSGPDLRIEYRFDAFETPESAVAYNGDLPVAKAEREHDEALVAEAAKGLPPENSEFSYFVVGETVFAPDGKGTPVYEGKILYRAPKMGAGVRDLGQGLSEAVREAKVSGEKRIDVWPRWTNISVPEVPCGGGVMSDGVMPGRMNF